MGWLVLAGCLALVSVGLRGIFSLITLLMVAVVRYHRPTQSSSPNSPSIRKWSKMTFKCSAGGASPPLPPRAGQHRSPVQQDSQVKPQNKYFTGRFKERFYSQNTSKRQLSKCVFSRRARREGFCGRSGRKASAAQPTFTELTGSEALDKPLQDMISYVIRSVKMVAVMEVVRLSFRWPGITK